MATVRTIELFPKFIGGCPPVFVPTARNNLIFHEVPLSDAMKLIWRVKKFSYSVSGGQITNQQSVFEQYQTATERDLICDILASHSVNGTIDDQTQENGWSVVIGAQDFDIIGGETGTYSMAIKEGSQKIMYCASGAFGGGELFGEFAGSSAEYLGECKFRFASDLGITIVAEPFEWWPYDPNDGLGPIYDKDSGRQLRQFPD